MATETVYFKSCKDTGRRTLAQDPVIQVYLQDGREGSAYSLHFLDMVDGQPHEIEVAPKGEFRGVQQFTFRHIPEPKEHPLNGSFVKDSYRTHEELKEKVNNSANAFKADKPKAEVTTWNSALQDASGKFMAITGKEKETLIEIGFATQLIESNDKLKACSKESISNAIINVAQTGTTLNPALQLSYLIPRDGKCTLEFSYRGLVKILKDYGCITHIEPVLVYADEEFEEGPTPITPPIHKRQYAETKEAEEKRKIKGGYCKVVLPKDNLVIFTAFKPYWEILEAEKASVSSNKEWSPWKKWRLAMIKKTLIKSAFPTLISGSPDPKALAALAVERDNEDYITHRNDTKAISGKKKRAELLGEAFGELEPKDFIELTHDEGIASDDTIKESKSKKKKSK